MWSKRSRLSLPRWRAATSPPKKHRPWQRCWKASAVQSRLLPWKPELQPWNRSEAMNQLDKRVSKLEQAMINRPPRLEGKSMQELVELVTANVADPKRLDLVIAGMNMEQLDVIIELMRQELANREKLKAIK